MKIQLTFHQLSFDGVGLPMSSPNLHRFVGRFDILVNNHNLYSEFDFCLVEFAAYLIKWLRELEEKPGDFIYQSVESEEAGLVWIKQGATGWRIGSVHQSYEEFHEFPLNSIVDAVNTYIQKLDRALQVQYNRSLSDLIEAFIAKMR